MIKIKYGPPRSLLQHCLGLTSTVYWITADRRRYHISKMEDGHLVNTVRKLRRDATQMLREAHDIGLKPYDAAPREDFLREVVKPYPALLREVAKRGLGKRAANLKRITVTEHLFEEWDNEFGDMWGNS